MDLRSLARNASVAFAAQGIAMCVSVATTLLVPKVLGVEQFGYWQLFVFYSTYVGFCHLGLNDGVYLVNGGRARGEIDRRSVGSQFVVGTAFQLVLAAVVLVLVATASLSSERSFVLGCVALYMVVKNAALYLGYVFQAMNETRLYSVSCILERLCFAAPLVLMLAFRVRTFEGYVLAYLVASVTQLFFCAWFARDFLRVGLEAPCEALSDAWASVRVGVKLMLANIASQLVLGVARFAIDVEWGIEAFGKLSLAISMVNFFLAFVTQASMVLFPALRQGGESEQKRFYVASRDAMSLVFPMAYLLYFPMRWVLSMWLPAYADSFAFFVWLLPVCVFDSRMNICCTTLFKVRREEGVLLVVNVATVVLSAAGVVVGVWGLRSVYAAIAAATIAIVVRSVVSECLLSGKLGVGSAARLSGGGLAVSLVFVVGASMLGDNLALVVTLTSYLAFLLLNRAKFLECVRFVRRATAR